MMRLILFILCSAAAFGSGTTTPGSKAGGGRCATSTIEGTVSAVDVERKTFVVRGRKFKVAGDTAFRIPGATKEDLKNAPLSKVTPNARAKVLYCSKDGTAVEVKLERQ
jgi:hypothetical protein